MTYYLTIVFLLIDPVYLSILSSFVGGGDMNGIVLIIPELAARLVFGVIVIMNSFVIIKYVAPLYRKAFLHKSKHRQTCEVLSK